MYIDVHAHLTDKAYNDFNATMSEIAGADVGLVICSGYDLESSYLARDLAEKHPNIYFSAGFQPQELDKYKPGDLARLQKLCRHEKCLAIGEIGLDDHYENNPPKDFQKEIFAAQLNLAHAEGLPVVIHSRDCAEDMLAFLHEHRDKLTHGGLLHCYSHSAEQSTHFERLGFYFSFGGTSTFSTARKVKKSVERISLERILTETDSPYLTPEPKRGQFPNTPANIPYIAKNLAQIKGMDEVEFVEQVYQNALRLFKKLPALQ